MKAKHKICFKFGRFNFELAMFWILRYSLVVLEGLAIIGMIITDSWVAISLFSVLLFLFAEIEEHVVIYTKALEMMIYDNKD